MTAILRLTPITTALSLTRGTVFQFGRGAIFKRPRSIGFWFNFSGTVTGGTSAKAYVQASLDGKQNWYDIACFAAANTAMKRMFNLSALTAVTSIATPGSAALADNTSLDGLIAPYLSVLYVTVGTYAGAAIEIDAEGDLPLTLAA